MKAEDWNKIEHLLEGALECPPSERRDFLELSCAGDNQLRNEVESLLACEAESEKFLQFPAVALAKGLFDDTDEPDSLVGQTIGNYRIISELGHGGMGAVYLAEREQPDFRQRVAVKLLNRELNRADIRRRFHQERQILAALEHPNITRLLDIGSTTDGVPFFVMEYIEGITVTEFCRSLTLKEILRLFGQICEVVAFAHRNLVVHRDLKPSNILICDNGTPKLLDFGISKLLTPEIELDTAAHTVTKLGAMTPEYASPEQLRGETITTSSDIYSLGVILYELLTNHRPFEFKKQNFEEVIRAVCQTNPEKPSAVITQELLIAKTQETATNQRTEFRNPKLLRGDLDNIVLMALRKEPQRRYGTVERFAEDIERHLQGLPVNARPNTLSYRAEKFIKRNYAGVAAGLLIIMLLLGGIAATLWQSRRAEQQRFLAEEQRARAQNRFNDVRKLANSFLFEIYPQIEKLEGATEARETLVKRALEYLDSLSQESSGDTGLQQELATAYEKVADVQGNPDQPNLGDTAGALTSYQKAQTLRELLVNENPENPNLRHELASNYEQTGIILWWSNESRKAIESYEKALELRRTLIAENQSSIEYQKGLADLQMDYGDIPAWNEESEKALLHYGEGQRILENLIAKKPDDEELQADLGRAMTRIGSTQKDLGDFDSAAASLKKAQEIFASLTNENPNNFGFKRGLWKVRFSECEMFLVKPDNNRAVESCSQLISLAEKLVNKDPKDTLMKHDLISSHNYAGDAFLLADMLNEAVMEFQKALSMNAELAAQFPDNNEYKRNIAILNLDLGKTYLRIGKIVAAFESNQKAVKLLEEISADDEENSVPRFNLATAYQQLGETCVKQRDFNKARILLIHSLEILQKLDIDGLLALRDKKLIPEIQNKISRLRRTEN